MLAVDIVVDMVDGDDESGILFIALIFASSLIVVVVLFISALDDDDDEFNTILFSNIDLFPVWFDADENCVVVVVNFESNANEEIFSSTNNVVVAIFCGGESDGGLMIIE